MRDHPLNDSRVALHRAFGEQRGQLRSPLSEHWPATITVCAASGRLRPPRTSWQRLFTTRSTVPLMVFREVPFGNSHVRLSGVQVRRFSPVRRAASFVAATALPFASRFSYVHAGSRISAVCGQPNRALHADGREAAHLGQSSSAPAAQQDVSFQGRAPNDAAGRIGRLL